MYRNKTTCVERCLNISTCDVINALLSQHKLDIWGFRGGRWNSIYTREALSRSSNSAFIQILSSTSNYIGDPRELNALMQFTCTCLSFCVGRSRVQLTDSQKQHRCSKGEATYHPPLATCLPNFSRNRPVASIRLRAFTARPGTSRTHP